MDIVKLSTIDGHKSNRKERRLMKKQAKFLNNFVENNKSEISKQLRQKVFDIMCYGSISDSWDFTSFRVN